RQSCRGSSELGDGAWPEHDARRKLEVEQRHRGNTGWGGQRWGETCKARLRYRNSNRLPSWGCSQSSFVVGIGPRLRRSMWGAAVAAGRNDWSSDITVATSVVQFFLSISACGHATTAAKGNIYSFCAAAASGESQCKIVGRR